MALPIPDNPYCKFCKRKYCRNKIKKDSVKDHNLKIELCTINSLSDRWSVRLKQNGFEYCPLDFYSPDIPLVGDVTAPHNKWLCPLTERWATPGWVVEFFKLSTLIDSAAYVGTLSFYAWAFEDGIRVLTGIDVVKKCIDTMEELTYKEKEESPHMRRSKGIYINPHRLQLPEYYMPDIQALLDHYKYNDQVDSTKDLEEEDY